jgi:hypothetical protein
MKMKKISALWIVLLLNFSAAAQSRRAPTAAEKTALMRVINPINRNIDLFIDNNWQKTKDFNEPNMDVPNSTRSHVTTGYSITLKIKEGSPLYKKLMQPVLRLIKENNNDSLQAAYATLQKQSVIHIDIEINGGVADLGSAPNKNQKLNIPGVAKAFIVAEDNNTTRRNGAFVLAFGHWENAKYNAELHCYNFKFSHPPQTPVIENAVIEIYGNSERINEIIKKCDWSTVTAGMDQ